MGLSVTEIEEWEAKAYDYGVQLPIPAMSEPSANWGDTGIKLSAKCPAAEYCGNPNVDANCTVVTNRTFKTPTFTAQSPFPATTEAPPLQSNFMFPPRVIIPKHCPNYPKKEAPPS